MREAFNRMPLIPIQEALARPHLLGKSVAVRVLRKGKDKTDVGVVARKPTSGDVCVVSACGSCGCTKVHCGTIAIVRFSAGCVMGCPSQALWCIGNFTHNRHLYVSSNIYLFLPTSFCVMADSLSTPSCQPRWRPGEKDSRHV